MKTSRFWLLIPLIVLQSSCALLTTNYSQMESQVEQWIVAKQYGRALDALSSVAPTDPLYPQAAEKRKEVETLAARYEQEVRRQTRADLGKGKWAQALDTYDEALDRLPKSAVLKDGLAHLHQEQAEELERLELERLLDHGEWLKRTLPTYEEIARVDPRNLIIGRQEQGTQNEWTKGGPNVQQAPQGKYTAEQRLQMIRAEAEQVASELALSGNKALANHQFKVADRTLSLAAELSDAPAITESLKKLRAQQEQARATARAEREKRQRKLELAEQRKAKSVNEHLKKYRSAFVEKDFRTAREHLKALQQIDKGNPRWDELMSVLVQATVEEVERLFNSGVTAYSRGQYEEAAKLWRKVLELDPEHKQAQESLDRAQRVLEKLEKLKEKQDDGN
jgi:tetratricopeptide (TPR) repeat protein